MIAKIKANRKSIIRLKNLLYIPLYLGFFILFFYLRSWAAILRHRFMTEKSLGAALIHLRRCKRPIWGHGGMFSYLCSFYLSCLFALSLGVGWMLAGLLGFYLCLLFVGFMGLVWMMVYL